MADNCAAISLETQINVSNSPLATPETLPVVSPKTKRYWLFLGATL